MAFASWKSRWRQHRLKLNGLGPKAARPAEAVGGGERWDGWHVVSGSLNADSVVYSVGLGNDIDFDLALIERFGVTVHGFDPTPESVNWLRQQALPPQFQLHACGLGARDGSLALFPPKRAGRFNYSQERLEYVTAEHRPIEVPVARLATLMKELGHDHVDLLKIDIEGGEFEVIPEILESGCSIGQLLVEVHYHYPTRSFADGARLIRRIEDAGLSCFHVSPRGYEFGFVATTPATLASSQAA